MDWLDEVGGKMKRRNQIYFSKESEFLSELSKQLDTASRRTIVLWALELAEEAVHTLEERYPDEKRPRNALEATRLWAAGKIKMPLAKKEILRCHAVAKEIQSFEDAALCHAIGQACGTVHTAGHALGLPIYELTALVRHYGLDTCREPVESRMAYYLDRLQYWQNHIDDQPREWAPFLLRHE